MDERVRAALDRNYRQSSAEMFACSDLGEALDTRHVHIATCGYPVAEFNWAFLKSPLGDAERGAERAERYFAERALPFRFIVRSDVAQDLRSMLESRGHVAMDTTTPGMALLPLPAGPPGPAELEIRRVEDEAGLADFQRTSFRGFGMPEKFGEAFLTHDLLTLETCSLVVGYVEGEPVATALLMATGTVAGIYWVATLESHRRRGYAEAVTWAALDAGRELDCRVGSLQASEMGRPVYERMGFVVSAEYVHFQRPSE